MPELREKFTWTCPWCGYSESLAFARNIPIMRRSHDHLHCPFRGIPLEKRVLSDGDKKWLEELKVSW